MAGDARRAPCRGDGDRRRFERRWNAVAARDPSSRPAILAGDAGAAALSLRASGLALRSPAARTSDAARVHARRRTSAWRCGGRSAPTPRAPIRCSTGARRSGGGERLAHGVRGAVNLAKLRDRRAGPKAALELIEARRAQIADHPDDERAGAATLHRGHVRRAAWRHAGRCRVLEGIRVARHGGLGARSRRVPVLAQVAERGGYFDIAERRADEAVAPVRASALHARSRRRRASGSASRDSSAASSPRRASIWSARYARRDVTRFGGVEAWARGDLAQLYFAIGDNELAREQAERAAALHTAYGDLWGLAVDLQYQGFVAQARGQLDDACAKYIASVNAFRRAGLGFNAVSSLRLLALAHMSAGRLDSAQHALDEATRMGRASANVGWDAELPVHLARLAMLRGDLRTADSLVAVARPQYGEPRRTVRLPGVQFDAARGAARPPYAPDATRRTARSRSSRRDSPRGAAR